jgi:transcriptional regulator with XRE-family HTH domain
MGRFDFSVVRNLRKKRGMTSGKLAETAGMTRSTIAKIESGEVNPTMGTIAALAGVFQLAPSELVHLAEKDGMEEGESRTIREGDWRGRRIGFPDFEVFFIQAPAGLRKDFDPRYHENTAEVCLVLSGRLRLTVGEETRELSEGMAVRFKALHSHGFHILADAEILLIHHPRGSPFQ